MTSQRSKSYGAFEKKVKEGVYRLDRKERRKNLTYINKEIPRLERKLEKKGSNLTQKKGYEEKVKKLKVLKKVIEEETNVENGNAKLSNVNTNTNTSSNSSANVKTIAKTLKATAKKNNTRKVSCEEKLKKIQEIISA